MLGNFPVVMPWVEVYEGGYVNHPEDPGGATNRGVTQRTYDAYRRSQGAPKRDVRMLTEEEHDAIYRSQYWNAIKGDGLPHGVDAAVFDFAVNSGVRRASKFLQSIVGAKPDGVIGFHTLAAVEAYVEENGAAALILALCNKRMTFLRRLRTFKTFGKGWTRRVMGKHDGAQDDDIGIVDRATMLAQLRRTRSEIGQDKIPAPKAPAAAKADDTARSLVAILADLFAAILEALGKGAKA